MNNDGEGGTALDPLTWSSAARTEPSVEDLAWLLGSTTLWPEAGMAGHTSSSPQVLLVLGFVQLTLW